MLLPDAVVKCNFKLRSWVFVDVRDLVIGYVMRDFSTILESKFVLASRMHQSMQSTTTLSVMN